MPEAEPDEIEPYASTLQHIDLIARKIAKLIAVQIDAERQVLHRAGRDFVAGRLSIDGLLELYQQYRDAVCAQGEYGKREYYPRPSFSELWNEAIPVHHSKVAQAAKAGWVLKRYEPNQGDGWTGENPLRQPDSRPRDGQSVVYVLFDAANVPCYVGSTEKFKTRIDSHTREKDFARWVAHPCADREAAYQLEVRLLAEHKPYLNKRRGR